MKGSHFTKKLPHPGPQQGATGMLAQFMGTPDIRAKSDPLS